MRRGWLVSFWYSFSTVGLLLGTLFFAASLTPTLIPRSFVTQGVLSGCSLAAGYGIGVLGDWLWTYMELLRPHGRARRVAKLGATAICGAVVVAFLWRSTQWQNSIRELMGLDPVTSAHPLKVSVIALATLAILIALARIFQLIFHLVSSRLRGFLPKRVAHVIGVIAGAALFWL